MEQYIESLMSKEEIKLIKDRILKVRNGSGILSWDEDLNEPYPKITATDRIIHNKSLGKIMLDVEIPMSVIDKLNKIASDNGFLSRFIRAGYVEYGAEWGNPRLNYHSDSIDLFMVDYQLEANTDWDLVVDGTTYGLQNNDALAFCPKRQMHGRPPKIFNDGEYVKMLFLDMEIVKG